MGTAVKYGLLAAALAVILAMMVVYLGNIPVSDTINSLTESVGGFTSAMTSYFQAARGFLNAFVGLPSLISFCIWYVLLMPFAKWAIRISVAVYRWINQ